MLHTGPLNVAVGERFSLGMAQQRNGVCSSPITLSLTPRSFVPLTAAHFEINIFMLL